MKDQKRVVTWNDYLQEIFEYTTTEIDFKRASTGQSKEEMPPDGNGEILMDDMQEILKITIANLN